MKTVKLSVTIFICLFFSFSKVFSQEILTWEECVKIAKDRNPNLQSAAEDVKQAQSDKAIQASGLLPQVSTTLTGKTAKAAASGATTDTYAYGVTGQQLIFDGMKTLSQVSSAAKTLLAEQYNYSLASSNIRLNLRNAFVELLRTQDLIVLTEEIAQRRKQNLELVRLRYEGGREHKGALLTAEADFALAEFEVAEAKRNISLALRSLVKELGINKTDVKEVKGEFSVLGDYDLASDFEDIADNTPFLRELIAKKEAARFNLGAEKADFLPAVYLNASAGRTQSKWPPRQDEWSAGLSISLPIFEGGARLARVSKAKSQLAQAAFDERSGRDSVLVTLEDTWKGLQDAIAYVSVQEKFLLATQERAKITRAQYEAGLTSFDDWIIIENNLVSAKKAYLNAQADMLTAEALWIQAIGGTLEYDKG